MTRRCSWQRVINFFSPKHDNYDYWEFCRLLSDLFAVRVDGDENRLVYFEVHVSKCIESLKQTLFMAQFKR